MNNNNINNRYYAVGSSESVRDIDGWAAAERSFYRNKHRSVKAQRIHIHPARVSRLARLVENGEYTPHPGYRFALFEPSPREIFAAFCEDRLVHHYVAPYIAEIAERIHLKNGDVSHGNRKCHSAQTGAEQIRDVAASMDSDAYIAKVDIKSCFPSVPRDLAYEDLERRAVECGMYDECMLFVCRLLIMHDTVPGSITLSSDTEMERIPERKRLKSGLVGFPIGNFYSQLVVNLYLANIDSALEQLGGCPRFVDDKCIIAKDKETAIEGVSIAKEAAEKLGLTLHPDKVYIQPVHHGVNFCGRTVKGKRIYLSSKTIRRALRTVKASDAVIYNAMSVRDSVNSYLGLMRHCTEHKNEVRLANAVTESFGDWLYFSDRKGHLVCAAKDEIIERKERERFINDTISNYNEVRKDYRRNSIAR